MQVILVFVVFSWRINHECVSDQLDIIEEDPNKY